jgi:hypothetical protein
VSVEFILKRVLVSKEPGEISRYRDGLDGRDSIRGSIFHSVHTDSEAHPSSYPMGTEGSFQGVKRPRRKADHSPPSSTEVKNG